MEIVVGFSTPRKFNILSWMIKWFEKSTFSHSFICIDHKVVFHATGDGVNLMPLSKFLERSKVQKQYFFKLDPYQEMRFDGFIKGCIGKEYSQAQLLLIVAEKYFGLINPKSNGFRKYICSELVADVMSYVFNWKFSEPHDFITPKELEAFLKGYVDGQTKRLD